MTTNPTSSVDRSVNVSNSLKQDEQNSVLEAVNLTVDITQNGNRSRVLNDVSITVYEGETVGLVGESGSGKSMFARTAMRLPPPNLELAIQGEINVSGSSIYSLDRRSLRRHRQQGMIGLIFQDPVSSLNPTMRVGDQIRESLLQKGTGQFTVASLLERVGLAQSTHKRFPHELSGGQRQRIIIAIALAGNPRILIADEATTALDPQVQRAIVDLIIDLKTDNNAGLLMISHDLEMIASVCQRIYVMREGVVVETNSAESLFADPKHWYTKQLISASARLANIGSGHR